ncbi:MAG TPA: hypothetical protein VFV37_05660 [Luteibaculaceae bacterium]|nr:hypothetical protein [Luteibaculaceae bacterium]
MGKVKKIKNTDNQNFEKEYSRIVSPSKTSVVLEFEWVKPGDHFQKLTIYDSTYTTIPALGETTLISEP